MYGNLNPFSDSYRIFESGLFVCIFFLLQDECSFVSLRDVERAMILFKFFMSKHKILKDKIEEKAGKKLKVG